MPTTLQSFVLTAALILPGFIVVELSETRRATRPARSSIELVLRGLAYALILQVVVALTGWTGEVLASLRAEDGWQDHLTQISVFALVVCVLAPTAIGLGLSTWLRRAEQSGRLYVWHYAFGARDYREAWDFVFGSQDGAYLLFTVSEAGTARHLLAKYGPKSWASQAPTRPQEIYVEAVWPADSDGFVAEDMLAREPARGMWISAEKIDRLEVLHALEADTVD
jgi:hypothetical protein